MQYAYLGRSGLSVSKLSLGTYNFGRTTDEAEAFRIMDAALEAGINLIDTANHYPDSSFVNCGLTEAIIGRWFAQGGGRRERVILASKVYQPMGDDAMGPNDKPGLSKFKLRRHCDDSLRRLQTDHIELYQMHHIDHRTGWDEVWEGFELLLHQGKVDYVGSSNFPAWQLARCQAAATQRQLFGLISEQHRYNLLCRLPELEVLPAAQAMGLGLLAYSPLAGSQLSGRIQPSTPANVQSFVQVCQELDQPPAVVALAWLLQQPAISSVILGPRTLPQLQSSLAALTLDLDQATAKRLDSLFPGPGQAPECYAW